MREKFIAKRFTASSSYLIQHANEILAEYAEMKLILTLRQLYYQFVARDLLPNKQSEYKRLGAIISDARLAGLVDWSMMEDRTRVLRSINTWDGPESIVDACARQYQEDLWAAQKCRPEVWIEKDALVGVIEAACRSLRVNYFACRGYASQSVQYEAGKRFQRYFKEGQTPVVFHLGDHDPSGMDMTRDNRERLMLFAYKPVEVIRLALNMNQINKYDPPPNPAKESDIRFAGYVSDYGIESWELDALEPKVIDELIRKNVKALIDTKAWSEAVRNEEINRDALKAVSDKWPKVRMYVSQ